MDCARAALRCRGVEEVTIVYRRAFEQMPASREEYEYALDDQVGFRWLRNPERFESDGTLTLRVMDLGEEDASGRRRPVPTEQTESFAVDSIVYAIGDDPDAEVLRSAGLDPDSMGRVVTGEGGETGLEGVFLIGDSRTGASTIVGCIAEGRRAADTICRKADSAWERRELIPFMDPGERKDDVQVKKGQVGLKPDPYEDYNVADFGRKEKARCLECDFICNKCVDVCPNRANIAVAVDDDLLFDDPNQIVHIDAYCNECGNCGQFCPWDGRPYLDKPTVFSTSEDFKGSTNPGWLLIGDQLKIRFEGSEESISLDGAAAEAGGNGMRGRFFALFQLLLKTRPHLFGPVEPPVPGVPR